MFSAGHRELLRFERRARDIFVLETVLTGMLDRSLPPHSRLRSTIRELGR
jgi:hypothetical protein